MTSLEADRKIRYNFSLTEDSHLHSPYELIYDFEGNELGPDHIFVAGTKYYLEVDSSVFVDLEQDTVQEYQNILYKFNRESRLNYTNAYLNEINGKPESFDITNNFDRKEKIIFFPERDVAIDLEITDGNFDTVLEVYSSDGVLLASDDDSGVGDLSKISNFETTNYNYYIIEITGYDNAFGSGTFKIDILE